MPVTLKVSQVPSLAASRQTPSLSVRSLVVKFAVTLAAKGDPGAARV
jgi:hypothetical protein